LPNITFRVESIRAERYSYEAVRQLNININLMLGKLEKSGEGYRLSFVVKVDCTPPIASMDVKGSAYVTPVNPGERRELEESARTGRPAPQLAVSVYGYVFPIIALLSRELGLPPPVPPPVSQEPSKRERMPGYL